MSHLLLQSEQARTTGTNSFVLFGEIHISGLLNDLVASHYCLEFSVCMYAPSLEQGHLFKKKLWSQLPLSGSLQWGMRCTHCTKSIRARGFRDREQSDALSIPLPG